MLTILPDAAARKPATPPPVLAYLLCIYVHAVLVILLPKTRLPALALLPVTLCLACYCAFRLDFVQWLAPLVEPLGFEAERLRHMSAFYVIIITAQSWRAIEWAMQSKPYRRLNLPEGDEKKLTVTEHPRDLGTVFVDALDLSWNMRGIGWSWTRTPFPVSHEYAPSLYMLFARVTFEWALLDAIHASIILRQPSLNNPKGDTIFDPSLPNPFFRLYNAALTTLSAGIIVFLGIDAGHGSFALLWRGLFRDPAWRWPPLFDAPWFATSIADFWARWHQLFRRQFAFLGGAFAKVTGLDRRVGTLLGAFVLSGILHDLATWGMSREDGAEPLSVSLFFVAMGVGIVVEQIWKPHGFFGWVWTYVWTVGWASRWIDSWARRGLMASMFCPDNWRPGKFLVELAWRTVSDKTGR